MVCLQATARTIMLQTFTKAAGVGLGLPDALVARFQSTYFRNVDRLRDSAKCR